MAVDNPNVIDFIGTAQSSGQVALTIADHLPWDEANEHLGILQAKINRYLEFIESGQLAEEYPNAKPGVLVRIEVVCKYQPSRGGERFLDLARREIKTAGWGFSWSVPTPTVVMHDLRPRV
ncbi:MAG: hypothetical protein JWO38_3978 [Gemmataceae bacterium]|nr:hypothetical protein [Gemmataceae bacterium]